MDDDHLAAAALEWDVVDAKRSDEPGPAPESRQLRGARTHQRSGASTTTAGTTAAGASSAKAAAPTETSSARRAGSGGASCSTTARAGAATHYLISPGSAELSPHACGFYQACGGDVNGHPFWRNSNGVFLFCSRSTGVWSLSSARSPNKHEAVLPKRESDFEAFQVEENALPSGGALWSIRAKDGGAEADSRTRAFLHVHSHTNDEAYHVSGCPIPEYNGTYAPSHAQPEANGHRHFRKAHKLSMVGTGWLHLYVSPDLSWVFGDTFSPGKNDCRMYVPCKASRVATALPLGPSVCHYWHEMTSKEAKAKDLPRGAKGAWEKASLQIEFKDVAADGALGKSSRTNAVTLF